MRRLDCHAGRHFQFRDILRYNRKTVLAYLAEGGLSAILGI